MCTRCSNQASPLHLQVHMIQAVNLSTEVYPGADASAADLVGAVSEDIDSYGGAWCVHTAHAMESE